MSLYFVYQHNNPLSNILKVGYMSTTNIQHIISRYKTYYGSDISVYMFVSSEPRLMEATFKSVFKEQHVELEFYDSTHLVHYTRWAATYANAAPIYGVGFHKWERMRTDDCPQAMIVEAPAMNVEAPAMNVEAPALNVEAPAMNLEPPVLKHFGAPAIKPSRPRVYSADDVFVEPYAIKCWLNEYIRKIKGFPTKDAFNYSTIQVKDYYSVETILNTFNVYVSLYISAWFSPEKKHYETQEEDPLKCLLIDFIRDEEFDEEFDAENDVFGPDYNYYSAQTQINKYTVSARLNITLHPCDDDDDLYTDDTPYGRRRRQMYSELGLTKKCRRSILNL
jgi:hypothetical protein